MVTMVGVAVALAGWHVLPPTVLELPAQHRQHLEVFGEAAPGFNRYVLQGIDQVQATAPDGGGYFIGIKAKPTESPIGYPIALCGQNLLSPPRTTSYCSGASYAAFVEGLNLWLSEGSYEVVRREFYDVEPLPRWVQQPIEIPSTQLEALRLQEIDGGRREDHVKFWGHWNADGFGNQFALVQYSQIGQRVSPEDARPGDFLNISWKSGIGHSTVFLGWCRTAEGKKAVRFWSSQKGTNGLGDMVSPLDTIASVFLVRVTNPERIRTFDVDRRVDRKVPGDSINWAD